MRPAGGLVTSREVIMHNKIFSSIETQKIVTVLFLGPPSDARPPGLDLNLVWSASVSGIRVDPLDPEVIAAVSREKGYHEVINLY